MRPDYLQGAVMILENRTGRILAAVGGRNYTDSQFNRAFDARRPAGSSFVPFVYAAAFENGSVNPATPLIDAPMNNRHVMIGGTMGVLGEWGAENLSNTYEGKIPAAYSLVEGKNAATVRLGNEVGLDAVKDFARRVGFKSQLRDYPSTYLGESEVTLAEMVRAFAVFPNQGLLCPEPHLIIDVQGNRSTLDYLEDSPASEQVISPLAAAQTTALLQASLQYGTASDVVNRHQLNPIGLAGKTGTAYGSTDCWFVGFNSEVTVGVWVGFDHPKSIGSHAFSRDLALPIWADLMASLPPARPFPNVDGITPEPICLKCGDLAVPGCPTKIRLPFSAEQRKHLKTCTEHAKLAMPVETTAPVLEPSSPQPAVALQPIPVRAQVLIGQDPYSNTQ